MIALLLAALFQSAAPASTAAAPAATPPAKAVQASKAGGTVCRKETVVGSTIKKKVCPRRIDPQQEAQDEGAEKMKTAGEP